MNSDIIFILRWWFTLFFLGIIFLPLTNRIFAPFYDRGYAFSKVLGTLIISYSIFILGITHILPFSFLTVITVCIIAAIINYYFLVTKDRLAFLRQSWRIILIEELIFLLGICFWAFIRGHEPSIHSLEKFMDYGFINSILRSTYFPPKDMWFTPLPINYYYFGHLTTAVLTRLTGIPSNISYNIMLATLFSYTFILSFSLASNFFSPFSKRKNIITGILAGILTTLGGNLHTIYTIFLPYQNEHPVPLWQLKFSPFTFPNSYWYANATRFIPFTIHEFPLYSFVVADLHGHVLDIPYVLLSIAVLFSVYKLKRIRIVTVIFMAFLLSCMYMTNAWDGIIYSLLTIFTVTLITYENIKKKKDWKKDFRSCIVPVLKWALLLLAGFYIFCFPFNRFFIPFVSGVGVVCAPDFLTKIGKIGPFLFEANHCQRSPWWQLLLLYGFFYLLVYWFLLALIIWTKKVARKETPFIIVLILLATLLIVIPEFIYAKDIYPAHYRANTMFKLVYQSFIMLSLVSAYIIMCLRDVMRKVVLIPIVFALIIFVLIFPYFAIQSYYQVPPPSVITSCNPNQPLCSLEVLQAISQKTIQDYKGLDGTAYLKTLYLDDYNVITWINSNIHGQPVIVEAQGDSYTDYERISANTGLPTILGWTVHEWLWRGTYDIPAPRIQEVKDIYESADIQKTKIILKKYNVEYIYVGSLERQKYPGIIESKFSKLGKSVFKSGTSTLYHL